MPKKSNHQTDLDNINQMINLLEEMLEDPETATEMLGLEGVQKLREQLDEAKRVRQELLTACREEADKNRFFRKDPNDDDKDKNSGGRGRSRQRPPSSIQSDRGIKTSMKSSH